MTPLFDQRLTLLSQGNNHHYLREILHGLERETLRVTSDLHLSQQPHPEALGAALTHPYITTDYSEAMLEFVTPTYNNPQEALDFLAELHTSALNALPDNEMIWSASMPAILQGDSSVPVARFGTSHTGTMKHIYRQGLGHRYGRTMQTIAGIHYNFSLGDEFWALLGETDDSKHLSLQAIKDSGYFAMARNFRRYAWLLSYLFGASPAMDKSFFAGQAITTLESLDDDTLYLPWATSLRMSDLGYTSSAQASLPTPYNSLDSYLATLRQATSTPYSDYQKIRVKVDGEYRQLNDNLLQIDNEFYSVIRPKCVPLPGEKPTDALADRGVEYLEIRNLDVNPLLPLGMDAAQARFLDIFLLSCALKESPKMTQEQYRQSNENFALSVREGRRPGLRLQDENRERTLREWAYELFEVMLPVARLLDNANETDLFTTSLNSEVRKLDDSSLTPSAQILARLQEGKSFRTLSGELARQHGDFFKSRPTRPEREVWFRQLAVESHEKQRHLEESDRISFDDYLREYNAPGTVAALVTRATAA